MHHLQRILQKTLILEMQHRHLSAVLALDPLRETEKRMLQPSGIVVTPHTSPLLEPAQQRPPWPFAGIWPKQNLEASLYPRIVYVLEGEVEFYVGLTKQLVKNEPRLSMAQGLYTVTLPLRTLFVVPPGLPIKFGRHPFMAVVPAEKAQSRTYWISVLPMGVLCYSYQINGAQNVERSEMFIPDYQCSMITEFMLDALNEDTPFSRSLAHSHLQSLFLRIDQVWTRSAMISAEAGFLNNLATSGDSEQTTSTLQMPEHPALPSPVGAAQSYIESHLSQPLNLDRIANNSFVSPMRLNRLFRSATGMSIQQYVRKTRIEAAAAMLEQTNLPVGWISKHFTFAHLSHFTMVFTKQMGLSPRAYRAFRRAATDDRLDQGGVARSVGASKSP